MVETAVVMIPLLMFIFGVFEYGRLLFVWNLLNNAAREGCRYALVNNAATTIQTDVTNVVTARMAGLSNTTTFASFSVTVSGTHNGVSTAVNNLYPGDMITVTVTGTNFKFLNIIPFHPMPAAFSLTSSVTMICEGGT